MRYNSGEGAWIPCLLEEKHSFDDCDIILLSPRSSVDRAVASGAMRAGSIPVGDAFRWERGTLPAFSCKTDALYRLSWTPEATALSTELRGLNRIISTRAGMPR